MSSYTEDQLEAEMARGQAERAAWKERAIENFVAMLRTVPERRVRRELERLGRRRFHYILAVISPAAVLDSVSAHEVMEETNRRDAARRSRPRIPLQLRRDNEL